MAETETNAEPTKSESWLPRFWHWLNKPLFENKPETVAATPEKPKAETSAPTAEKPAEPEKKPEEPFRTKAAGAIFDTMTYVDFKAAEWLAKATGHPEYVEPLKVAQQETKKTVKAFATHPIDTAKAAKDKLQTESLKSPTARALAREENVATLYKIEEVKDTDTGATTGFKFKDPNSDQYAKEYVEGSMEGKDLVLCYTDKKEIYENVTEIENKYGLVIDRKEIPYWDRIKNVYKDFTTGHKTEAMTDIPGILGDGMDHFSELIGSKLSTFGFGAAMMGGAAVLGMTTGVIGWFGGPVASLSVGAVALGIGALGAFIAASPLIPGTEGFVSSLTGIKTNEPKKDLDVALSHYREIIKNEPAKQPEAQKATAAPELPAPTITAPAPAPETEAEPSAEMETSSIETQQSRAFAKVIPASSLRSASSSSSSRSSASSKPRTSPDSTFVEMVSEQSTGIERA